MIRRWRFSETPAGRCPVRDFLGALSDTDAAAVAAANPDFPVMVEEALARRQLLRQLAQSRQAEGLTRTTVAARMGTSESAVARLEGGEADTKLSTVARYAAALGKRVEWRVVDHQRARTGA